jgi:hypothetical protein
MKGRPEGTYLDLAGRRYGRLTAVRPAGKYKENEYLWLCKCDCGGEKTVRITSLRCGHTKSCGCLVRKRQKAVAA